MLQTCANWIQVERRLPNLIAITACDPHDSVLIVSPYRILFGEHDFVLKILSVQLQFFVRAIFRRLGTMRVHFYRRRERARFDSWIFVVTFLESLQRNHLRVVKIRVKRRFFGVLMVNHMQLKSVAFLSVRLDAFQCGFITWSLSFYWVQQTTRPLRRQILFLIVLLLWNFGCFSIAIEFSLMNSCWQGWTGRNCIILLFHVLWLKIID